MLVHPDVSQKETAWFLRYYVDFDGFDSSTELEFFKIYLYLRASSLVFDKVVMEEENQVLLTNVTAQYGLSVTALFVPCKVVYKYVYGTFLGHLSTAYVDTENSS